MRTRINSGFYFVYQKSKVHIIELFLYFPNKSIDFIVRLTEHKPRIQQKARRDWKSSGLQHNEVIMNTKVDEGKLISGKEALIAIGEGEEIEYKFKDSNGWMPQNCLTIDGYLSDVAIFRLKPRTITINGIEVPAPFEPKIGEYVYFISSDEVKGYAETTLVDTEMNWGFVQFGAWRTEEEIKQVVAALRQVFGGSHDN